FEKLFYAGPVTSLCFHNDDILFSGEGPYLKAFNVTTGKLINSSIVLEYFRIHRIVPDINNYTINCTFNLISKLPPLKDWIHDIHWLYDDINSIIKSISQIPELELSSSKLSKLELPSELAIAFAHNFVEIWNITDNCCLYSVQCEERCILYSARFFGDNRNDLVLASGTVFNQVLLWKIISKNEQHEQQGVVRFSDDGKLVASVSDDRTIRLWQTDASNDMYSDKPLVLYGHMARIWDCYITDNYLISISEDSTCRVWKNSFTNNSNKNNNDDEGDISDVSDVDCLACWEGHVGKNVWSLAINPSRKIVATGGGDSGLRLWSLSTITDNKIDSEKDLIKVCLPPPESYLSYIQQNMNLPSREHIRNFLLIDYRVIVISTNFGHILKHNNLTNEWKSLYNSKNLHNYTMMKSSNCGRIVCCGSIYVSHAVQNDILLLKFDFNDNEPILETLYKLNVPSQFLLMSLAFCPSYNILVCGSRDSGLVIYNLNQAPPFSSSHPINELSPIIYLNKIHGKQSVTSIALKVENLVINSYVVHDPADNFTVDNDKKVLIIYTTGRDGCYAKFRLKGITNKYKNDKYDVNTTENYQNSKEDYNKFLVRSYIDEDSDDKRSYIDENKTTVIVSNHGLILEEVYRAKITKGWLEKVLFVDDELMLLGFYRKRFFVYNEFKKFQIFSVACGGAHRVWHFKAQDKKMNKSSFMFIRKENVFIYSRETHDNQGFDECELQGNFHGRECRTVKFLKNDQNKAIIFATGAEDSILRLFQYNVEGYLVNLCSIKKHTSVIRSIEWSYGKGLLLFSSGASEELVCWKVEVKFKNDTIIIENSVANVNCLEWASCPAISEIPETRIMDISVFSIIPGQGIHIIAAGYSDSALRVWLFDEENREFLLIGYAKIAMFDISQVVFKILNTYKNENTSFTHQNLGDPIYSYQAHQSGVNCINIHKIPKNSKNIATNTFEKFITTFMIATDQHLNLWKIPSLDSIKYIESKESKDFRDNDFCDIDSNSDNNQEFQLIKSEFINVHDTSSMDILNIGESGEMIIAITGIGIELLKF
ncbi:2486_t:CDS:10, partial [Diversispora eburnea]